MLNRTIEIIAGIFVIIVILIFLIFVVISLNKNNKTSVYNLYASFNNVGGLDVGSFVMLNGVKIGRVDDIKINTQDLKVDVKLSVDSNIKIPVDSSAEIDTNDLVGTKIINLKVGSSATTFKNDAIITNTKGFVSLEQKIGDILTTVVK